jgi:signal transduction histidine kinase
MAKIVTLGRDPPQQAFALLDDDAGSHAEWHNATESAPAVSPGEHLVVEWNEAFSIGLGGITNATYAKLPQGNYSFHVAEFDIFGNPTGMEDSIAVIVPPPFWKTAWFWALVISAILAVIMGSWRYLVRRRMRVEVLRLKNQQALEQERLRIAQDIHDDLGARITEISLASALAKKKSPLPDSASADFDRISDMSRELVSALYETVWAVNPENDNLDALGNYLCQMTIHLCEQAQLPCRLKVVELPGQVQVSSQTRHNIIMAAKEAVHNVIKHAKASEVTLRVAFEDGVLTVCIQDNGAGFRPNGSPAGNGLTNMRRRLTALGGSFSVENRAEGGTCVNLRLVLPPVS